MTFTLEQIYNCTRKEYMDATGITSAELIKHLEAEISMLQSSLLHHQLVYRDGPSPIDPSQRELAELLSIIEQKINSKQAKIQDIQSNV